MGRSCLFEVKREVLRWSAVLVVVCEKRNKKSFRMDMTTRLKCLLMAIQQYKESRTATNAAKLQKQVEEVSSLPPEQLLTPSQALPTECVTGLVDLAGNPNTSLALTSSIVSLLEQLACDDESREVLHSSYSLTSTLASIIHSHSATPGEPLVLQCLRVLQKLTYSTRIFQSMNYFHELITFLMINIQSHNDELITPCLGLMAHLCRDNHSVQSHIKSLDNVKPFYRTLINFLAHNSLTVVVFTLSILASLTMNEKVGEKLFDAKNIHQTFQLVFNLIVNGTDTCKYAVDLLVDLLKNAKIADYLTRYKHFSVCVSKVLGLLHSKDPESAAKVLELLLSMCHISGLRSLLCEVVFKPATAPKLRAGRRPGHDPDVKESGVVLVQCLSSSVDGAEARTLQALQLLHELMEEALGADSVADCVLIYVEILLPVLVDLLRGLDSAEGDAQLKKHCTRITHVTSLLLVLCAEDSTRTVVSRQVSAQLCLSQVEELLSCCHNNSPLTCPAPPSDNSLSQVSSEALLKTLELMSKLRQQVKDMVTSFYKMLQDQRIVTPLSLALTSHHRESVQSALSLLFEATPLPEFPALILGECIAANNAYRQREAELSVKRVAVQEFPPTRTNCSILDSSTGSIHKTVNGLADKMLNGLAEKPKDSLVSEVINVYEQKLSAFESKESRLQDLLEAKALALSQADRLISQFRVQQAQAEAEARKLGSLLKEAERRREELQCDLGNQVLEVERCKSDIEELLKHNGRLQQDSEEHQTLKGAYNTLLNRLNESDRLLKELQAAHISLTKQNENLKKNHETLQLQNDRMVALVEEREEEIKSLHSDLEQKDSDLTDLRSELRAEEQKLKEKEQERRDLEETVDVLRKELDKTQQARKDTSIKASSLEQQKSQLELKLKQKEDELNKHSAMIAMIHSLSSGKMKNDSNVSL
ncbi:protein CIP2A isoform X2 [Boleophthalmus pectinirostris]|uniref:protein CIP2A isoform X2 n=1 Tax=Boleophthalmus pectinirostris TaxID=150288 RepID=UPI0024333218|nr:protein CIP2A isoform X2 [Boleophthalmus pectinirostris]